MPLPFILGAVIAKAAVVGAAAVGVAGVGAVAVAVASCLGNLSDNAIVLSSLKNNVISL